MLSKTIVLIVTMVFSLQSMASNGVKLAFDEFTYAMEVEGAAFNPHDSRIAHEKLMTALQESGLSDLEILNYSLTQIKDQKLRKDIESVIQSGHSAEETKSLIHQAISESYSEGASWNGDPVFGVLVLLLLGGLLTYFVMLLFFPKTMIRNGWMDCPSNYSEAHCADWYDTQTVGTPPGWEPGMPYIRR